MSDAKQVLSPPLPPQWVMDVNDPPTTTGKTASIPDPPGFAAASLPMGTKRAPGNSKQSHPIGRKAPSNTEMDTLKMKKAWEVALAPAKSLPMSAFGAYMTGNTLQVFSIFMVFTLFKTPIQAALNINNVFVRFESEGTKNMLIGIKIAYLATNLLALGLGVWKVHQMGLLPTTRSDWLAWETQQMPLDRAYPAFDI